jgi:transcription-repair coupling factor (superfamily II helicase)
MVRSFLRGAGDVLGGEQSGTVATAGFDLFCRMLEEAVHELRGEEIVHEVDPELTFDVVALLPETYLSDVGVRLSLYKRLASAVDEAHVAEIAEEMENRLGARPSEAKRRKRPTADRHWGVAPDGCVQSLRSGVAARSGEAYTR